MVFIRLIIYKRNKKKKEDIERGKLLFGCKALDTTILIYDNLKK